MTTPDAAAAPLPRQAAAAPQAGAPSAVEAAAADLQRPPLISSETLLRGHRSVEISHLGVLYRLQATRQGKLILTK